MYVVINTIKYRFCVTEAIMEKTEPILRPFKNIRGGATLPHNKTTAESAAVIMPPPEKVVIPMQQHIGAPCVPCVKKGDAVFVGTKVGDSEKFISAPIHSSVSGTVTGITQVCLPSGQRCDAVEIESDGNMTADPMLSPIKVETPEDLAKAARDSGLVGLGGAGFPAHVKLKINPECPPDVLIVNGAECEPFITSDYRECLESGEHILNGIYLIKKILGIKKVIIAVENNKPRAIELLYSMAADKRDINNEVQLMKLHSHYPQGAEKVLIYTATGRKVPLGKLPADVGCIVMNVTSISTLNKYITTGMPLVSKTVTVDGRAIRNPQNVVVPIGTSVKEVIDFCGGFKSPAKKVLAGGPMMGTAIIDLSLPVMKQNNSILALDRRQTDRGTEQPCIRCGRCAAACPMSLQPLEIEPALKNGNTELIKNLHADYCIECGSCAFSCPSKRPLTQVMRLAKGELKNKK